VRDVQAVLAVLPVLPVLTMTPAEIDRAASIPLPLSAARFDWRR